MSEITKDQAKDLSNAFQCWQQDYDPVEDKEQYDMFGLGMVAMDVLLASLEAEPVSVFKIDHESSLIKHVKKVVSETNAPPAPVSVPDEVTTEDCPAFVKYDVTDVDEAWSRGWNACRAAMLQGAEPVTTAYKLPEGWVAVPVEPTEDMIVNGFESEPDESFSDADVWEAYESMSGCQQAAHRAKLCWAAMIAAAPKQEVK